MGNDIYENYKVCPELKPGQICVVVEKYEPNPKSVDLFVRKFHYHIPAHRISVDDQISLLRSLICHFEQCGPEKIVGYHLNNRKGGESKIPLKSYVSYPEKGVIRRYFGANTKAWTDSVIRESDFRVR